MSRGRSPEGETALSNAERQARYRDRHKQGPVVVVQSHKPVDRRPRPQRWHHAVTECWRFRPPTPPGLKPCQSRCAARRPPTPSRPLLKLDLDALAAITPPRGYGRD